MKKFLALSLAILAVSLIYYFAINKAPLPIRQANVEVNRLIEKVVPPSIDPFDRSISQQNIQNKIKQGKSLSIHLMIPLCDNDHQGIVPVNKTLGDGFNTKSNLYWGAMYGFKSFFKKKTDWKLLETQKDPTDTILERLLFSKKFSNGASVFLVADAYRGDYMKPCLEDFLNSVSGIEKANFNYQGKEIGIKGKADLIVFNGHNGLMDYQMPIYHNTDGVQREAAVIGCISDSYFQNHLNQARAYPVLTTTGLMAPEAYVLESLVDAWGNGKSEREIRLAAASAYHEYQKCGMRGAKGLFKVK